MLIVRNIRVYCLERDANTVTWEIAETTDSVDAYSVEVWRSEAAYGPYQRVSKQMNAADVYEFSDRGVNLLSKWREFYYRIRIINTATAEYQDYGSTPHKAVLADNANPGGVSAEAPPDLEAMEVRRQFDLFLREYAGRRRLVLPVRSWGQRCAVCWDELKRRRNVSRCKACYDTGFTGGYYSPVKTLAHRPPMSVVKMLTPLFEMQPLDVLMWFPLAPRIKPADLVIDIEGRRWRIMKTSKSEKGESAIRYTAQVRMLSRDQVEYDIPISSTAWAVDTMTASPMRQHIRATDISSYQKALEDLGLTEETVFDTRGDIATTLEGSTR